MRRPTIIKKCGHVHSEHKSFLFIFFKPFPMKKTIKNGTIGITLKVITESISSPIASPLPRDHTPIPSTNWQSQRFNGADTPDRSAISTRLPLIQRISVVLEASTSASIDEILPDVNRHT